MRAVRTPFPAGGSIRSHQSPAAGRPRSFTPHCPGIDLLVRRKPGVPLVTLGIYVPRLEFEPPSLAGLGALTVRSSVRAAGDLDAGELAFAFERLGGTLSATAAADWLGFGSSVLSENLGEAAALLELVFTAPRLEDSEVLTERDLMVVEAEQVTDDMFRYPFQLAFAEAFGDAGYGLPVGGLPETLGSISPADVRDWHSRAMLGTRPLVVAVGDVDPERAAATLAGAFRNRPSPGAARPPGSARTLGRRKGPAGSSTGKRRSRRLP